MGAAQKDKGSALVKWRLITVSILGAALVIAAIWFLSRALTDSAPQGSVALTNAATTPNTALIQEEIESQHDMAVQQAQPVIQAPVAEQSAVIPAKQTGDEVALQRAKAKVNRRIVERMKQYVIDNPDRDTLEIEEQIKKREKQDVPIQ